MKSRSKARRGKGGEATALLVLSLLLLVLVSAYTLLSYRASLSQLLEARRDEAHTLARHVADQLEDTASPRPADLRNWAPQAHAVTLFDDRGHVLVASRLDQEAAASPGRPFSQATVHGLSRLVRRSAAFEVQVDLHSPVLRARARTLRFMVPVVLAVDVGVVLLLLVYARRWIRPWEKIMDRAARLSPDDASGDEVELLLSTFERALQSLSQPEERELKAVQSLLGRSLESGVLVCAADGRVLALNPVGADILNLPQDPSGRPVEEFLEDFPELLDNVRPALEQGISVQRAECRVQTEAGDRTLGLTAHPLRRDDGGLRGFLVLFADLTEIKRRLAAERLSESLRQLGELTAGVAHEMRNGMATLKGYLELIAGADADESVDDYVEELRRETDSLHRILEDFLTFARPGGRHTEAVELEAILHRAAADPALTVGTRVEIALPEGTSAEIMGDGNLLTRALLNLLLNSGQAQETAGVDEPVRLRLTEAPEGAEYVIEVLDAGLGIPAHLEGRLFEPFVTGRAEGVGLGLALARRIALLHGGSLDLENRAEGGARALLRLPSGRSVT